MSDDPRQLAAEVFLTAAGPALVKRVAETLQPRAIPVMPLKGVLLQKLVYGASTFRPITDVDLLVPENRFSEAVAALHQAGFTRQRWEQGGWQVTVRDPAGPPLGIDLHRKVTRTARSRLTATEMFARARCDVRLFGAAVFVPCANDLFAHLLLHATLHWINLGSVHRPDDFRAMPGAVTELDVRNCASHLDRLGLLSHGLVMLPLILRSGPSAFLQELLTAIQARCTIRQRLVAEMVRGVCSRPTVHQGARRIAGFILAPSPAQALVSATRDRLGA